MKKRIIVGASLFIITFASAFSKAVPTNVLPGSGVHNILSTQLPLDLLTNIKKEYKDYWITGLYEEGKIKQLSYFITVENADQIIKLSSDDSENWVVISTTIKDN
jgi:hypothetical protein